MTGICGAFSTQPANDIDATLRRMLATAGAPLGSDAMKVRGDAGLAIFGQKERPQLIEHEGLTLAIVGHPTLRPAGESTSDPIAIAKALRANGASILSALGGDF